MCGRNVAARLDEPTKVATNTALRDVVIPGATGLPTLPRNEMSIAGLLSSASRPPTRYPRGHESWYSTRARGAAPREGTTTHGPATRTQTCRPRHSFVASARVAPAASTAH